MPWAKFDNQYPEHRKVRRLSDAAFRLDVSAICWCARYLTDGVVPVEELTQISPVRNPERLAEHLVAAGRWDAIPGGWMIHDYLDYNPSKQEIETKRMDRTRAGRAGGVASGQSRRRSKPEANGSGVLREPVKQT